jgi:hypothetical protein
MMGLLRAGILSLGILAFCGAANAGTLVLTPGSPGVDGVQGNTTTNAPGFDTGSFQANSTLSLDVPKKSQIYVDPAALFGHSITVGQIASMSYFTNKPGASNTFDWSLYVYTNFIVGGTDNTGTFYQSRLTAEPLYSNPPSVPANTWHQWSTNDPNSPLKFYDAARSGAQGTASDPTLAQLQNGGGSFTWPTNISHNYNNEVVKYLSFQTGSAWAAGFNGLLDGFDIRLSNNETGAINFEAVPVPVPSPVWAGLVLLAGLAAFKFPRKASIA